jgi:hypothetical protein
VGLIGVESGKLFREVAMTLTFITPDELAGFKQIIPGDDFVQPEEGFFVEELPPGPSSTWLIDWEDQTITSDWQPPPVPDWDSLTAAILLNPEWQEATNIVRGINPGIVESLGAAMTQLSSGQYNQFNFLFNQICTIAEVPQAQREAWAVIGEECNMPNEFLDIVRGKSNG